MRGLSSFSSLVVRTGRRLRASGDPATVAKATAYPDKMADLRYVRQHTDGRHEDAHNGLRVALVSRGVIPAKGYANESRKPSSDSRDDGPPRPKPRSCRLRRTNEPRRLRDADQRQNRTAGRRECRQADERRRQKLEPPR